MIVNKLKNIKNIYFILFFIIIFLSVGFSAFNINSFIEDIAVGVRVVKDIRVTGVNIDTDNTSSDVITNYLDYNVNNISSEVYLPSANSFVTYRVSITNFEDPIMGIFDITGLSDNLEYYISDYSLKDKLCDDNNKCNLGMTKDIYITIKYKDNMYDSSNYLYNFTLLFDFRVFYNITYENFSSISDYPIHVIEGDTLSVSFGSLDAPIEIKKGGSILSSNDYTYNNYNLTISYVYDDIHIRKLTRYTIINKVTNGSFENGLTGWMKIGGTSYYTWHETTIAKFGSKAYYRMSGSSHSDNYLRQTLSFKENHQYYFFAHAICTSVQPFYADIVNTTSNISFNAIPQNWRKGSIIYTSAVTESRYIHINFGAISDNVIVDGIGMVDLTSAFGAGNEPSLDWCNNNISYFDGSLVVYK